MNNRGMSLAGVIVAIGLMGILTTVMASVFTAQHRESKALQEKLASMDFEKLLIQSLANGQVCNYVLNNPTQITFNSNGPLPKKLTPSLPLYSHMKDPSTPGVVVAQVGELASAVSQSLRVESINLELISKSGNSYLGRWVIEFDNTNTVRHVKPVTVSTTVTADLTDPNNATISTCQSENSSSGYGYVEANSVSFFGSKTILTYTIQSKGTPFVLFYKGSASGENENSTWDIEIAVQENGSQILYSKDRRQTTSDSGGLIASFNGEMVRELPEGPVTYKIVVDTSSSACGCSAGGRLFAMDL